MLIFAAHYYYLKYCTAVPSLHLCHARYHERMTPQYRCKELMQRHARLWLLYYHQYTMAVSIRLNGFGSSCKMHDILNRRSERVIRDKLPINTLLEYHFIRMGVPLIAVTLLRIKYWRMSQNRPPEWMFSLLPIGYDASRRSCRLHELISSRILCFRSRWIRAIMVWISTAALSECRAIDEGAQRAAAYRWQWHKMTMATAWYYYANARRLARPRPL